MEFEMNAQGSIPEEQMERENDMPAPGISGRNHENIFIERPLAANPEIHPVNGKHAPDDEDDEDDDDAEDDLILGDEELAGDEEEFDVELDDADIDEDDIDEDDLVIGTDDPNDEEEDDDL
jgi:hypothetical protein